MMKIRIHGVTLIELLVCVAIVAILTGISLVSYKGSVDASDFKFAMPRIAEKIGELQGQANSLKCLITAEFVEGEALIKVTCHKKDAPATGQIDPRAEQLLRRPLVFKRYEWPDGAREPRTFTFFPNAKPQGGTVWFGTAFAEGRIYLNGSRVDWAI